MKDKVIKFLCNHFVEVNEALLWFCMKKDRGVEWFILRPDAHVSCIVTGFVIFCSNDASSENHGNQHRPS